MVIPDEPPAGPAAVYVPAAVPAVPVLVVLPDAVRRQVLEVAANVLGLLADGQVPAALTRVRRFAPARRATSGALPLSTALERDDTFRAQVAAAVREAAPELAALLDQGDLPATADPVDVAAAAYLLRGPRWQELVAGCVAALQGAAQQQQRRADQDELARARADLQRVQQRHDVLRRDLEAAGAVALAEVAGLRRELRRHRSDADRARALARQAQQDAEQVTAAAHEQLRRADRRAEQAEAALAAAQQQAEALRRADREGRSLAGARARLLLDTVVEAATGLRRELALPPAVVRPADLVGEPTGPPSAPGTPPRARDADDPAVLAELLVLPQAHLLVDGYNVTKTAYGDQPLSVQRSRLLSGLAVVQARTGAEVTCCFDGSVVEGRVTPPPARGVRVRFSAPGQTADDLIRRLVRAEPPGRVVVVVSTDREVADGVRAAGARAVPSLALVRLLDRR